MQSDITIADDIISGTLLYVTGYTGFSGDPDEQEGNFLALAVERKSGVDLTVEIIGGNSEGHPVEMAADDELLVARITSTTQKIKFVAYIDEEAVETRVFQLSGLTLTPDEEA